MKRKWAEHVRRTRDKWEPTKYSVLCSKHFENHCFEPFSKIPASLGLKAKPLLKKDAVPTIFEKLSVLKRKTPTFTVPEPKKRRTVYEKRERHRIS